MWFFKTILSISRCLSFQRWTYGYKYSNKGTTSTSNLRYQLSIFFFNLNWCNKLDISRLNKLLHIFLMIFTEIKSTIEFFVQIYLIPLSWSKKDPKNVSLFHFSTLYKSIIYCDRGCYYYCVCLFIPLLFKTDALIPFDLMKYFQLLIVHFSPYHFLIMNICMHIYQNWVK